MSRYLWGFWGFCVSVLVLGGCIDRYTPEVAPDEQANLVVDGAINPRGSTVVRLSRTFSINTRQNAPAETRALVVIQDNTGRRYPLTESPAGTYTSAANTLDVARQYQLRITTAPGREYASDLTPIIVTPPIDTLTWQITPPGGAQIYVSTHATDAAARHYRWEYEETYQFSIVIGMNGVFCWRTQSSIEILQGATAQLLTNRVADFPLLTLLPDLKLRYGYSVLVRQYAQTQSEYDYWERLRKTTQSLGTVNDPLPSRVTGNVHALADPTEPVMGYVGAHTVTEKRLFIGTARFPAPRPESVFYDYITPACGCTDCPLGTKMKPSFWP
jgi:hypothetical protein